MCQTTGTLVHYSSFNSSSFILITIVSLHISIDVGLNLRNRKLEEVLLVCVLHKQHYFHVHAHCSACWRGMRKIRFQVSGLWFFPEKRWKMSKQQFWCAVDSEERVWAINHLLPQTIVLSSKLMAKSCTMRKGWGGFNEQRKLSSAPSWFGGQPCTLSIRSLWIASIWFVSTNMSSFR